MVNHHSLETFPIHLGLGASAVVQPEMTGSMDWYEGYSQRHAADGAEGRLVSQYTFGENWKMWEMHPHGTEVVLCVSGCVTLIQEKEDVPHDGVAVDGDTTKTLTTVVLQPGDYGINPPGCWHTADVSVESTVVFITAGLGTLHRPRSV
jgi:hypothetical protein